MKFGRIVGLVFLFLFSELVVALTASSFGQNPLLWCGVMTALAVAIGFSYLAVMRWYTRPRVAAAPPAPSAPSPGRGAGTVGMASIIHEANLTLANSPKYAGAGTKPTIFDLPLYLVMGPEQCGKTSAIYQSGMTPTLLAGEAQRDLEIVPTHLLNLWFAKDAIFADFSGRLMSDDGAQWTDALAALQRKPRSSRWRKLLDFGERDSKLRGVVLCIDVSVFLGTAEPKRVSALAHQVNERLQQAGASFGVNFPVYVLFTQADRIPFFEQFFARISEEEEQQVVGSTLRLGQVAAGTDEVYAQTENKRLGSAFDRLADALAGKRVTYLARESEVSNKPDVYEHPREWRRLRPELIQFLVEAFRPNVLAAGPLLRGFYFSGVRHAPAPARAAIIAADAAPARDVLASSQLFRPDMPATGVGPKIAPRTPLSRWVFLTGLFENIILADRGTAPPPPMDTDKRVKQLILGGATALGAIAALTFLVSWAGNWSMLSRAEDVARSAAVARPDTPVVRASLDRLDALRQQIVRLRQWEAEGAPWRYRFGLYSGNRALASLRAEYFALFRQPFYEPMVKTLEGQFLGLPQDPTSVYDRVYAYKAITSGKCTPGEPLVMELPRVWNGQRFLTDPESIEVARSQVLFYIDELKHQNPYAKRAEHSEAVAKAVDYLKGSAASRYPGMIQSVNRKMKPALLADYAGPDYARVLDAPPQVDGAFTQAGWREFEILVAKRDWRQGRDDCVLGQYPQLLNTDEIETQLRSSYTAEYIRRWIDFLSNSHVKMAGRNENADNASRLALLGDTNSPLLGLLAMVSEHTKPLDDKKAPGGPAAPARSAAEAIKSRIEKTLGGGALPQTEAAANWHASVERTFQPVHAVITVPDPKQKLETEANSAYVRALRKFGESLRMVSLNPDPAITDQASAARTEAVDAWTKITSGFNIDTQGVDVQVKRLLKEPLGFEAVLDRYSIEKQKLNGAMSALCRKVSGLRGRFPFDRTKAAEVSLEQFHSVFAPSSLAPLQEVVSPYLQFDGAGGYVSTNRELRIPPDMARFYSSIMSVSRAFYQGADHPQVRYSLVLSTRSQVKDATFYQGDREIKVKPGDSNAKSTNSVWTGAPVAVGIRVKRSDSDVPFGRYEGVWSIFRLLANADELKPPLFLINKVRQGTGQPEPYLDRKGVPIEVRLEVSATPDVFAPGFLRIPACPTPLK